MTVYTSLNSLDFDLSDVTNRERDFDVLMAHPEYFDVKYEINPYMDSSNKVNNQEAFKQWENLKSIYESLGYNVHVLEPVEGLPDLVFTANQSFPYFHNGHREVVLSNMASKHRQNEVEQLNDWYKKSEFKIRRIDRNKIFEGMGDAIKHPSKDLIWGGHGIRTSVDAYKALNNYTRSKIVTLKIDNNRFYHLDTCFTVLDSKTVLIAPDAFSKESLAKIHRLWPTVIEAPINEAAESFACNAHCPDKESVIIQEGNTQTEELLESHGFKVVETDTSEFMKAGGSVFCMKMMIPSLN